MGGPGYRREDSSGLARRFGERVIARPSQGWSRPRIPAQPAAGVSITFPQQQAIALGPLEHFNVQPVLDDGTIDKTRNVTVEATSPLKAGEAALGQPLALEGKPVRAIVWRLTAGFVPLRVTLYDVDMVADATPTE